MKKYSKKRQFGNIGEELAAFYLQNNGLQIIDTNVLRKWGEIDIVALENETLHFVEVKTAKVGSSIEAYQNLTRNKLKKCIRSAEMYVLESEWSGNYQIDLLCVTLDPGDIQSTKFEYIPNIS